MLLVPLPIMPHIMSKIKIGGLPKSVVIFLLGFIIGAYSHSRNYENLETTAKAATAVTYWTFDKVGELVGEPDRKGKKIKRGK